MATAALVSCADGPVTFAKRNTLDRILDTVDDLKVFNVHDAIDLFNDYASGIRNQPDEGAAQAMEAATAIAGQEIQAQLLMRIALAIAKADGSPGGAQITRIKELAATLGVEPPNFQEAAAERRSRRAKIITLGNQKGGTGKSTTAMHLAVALLKLGYRVGTIDLDGGQGTLSRYVDVLGVRKVRREGDWERDRQELLLHSYARHATVPVGFGFRGHLGLEVIGLVQPRIQQLVAYGRLQVGALGYCSRQYRTHDPRLEFGETAQRIARR